MDDDDSLLLFRCSCVFCADDSSNERFPQTVGHRVYTQSAYREYADAASNRKMIETVSHIIGTQTAFLQCGRDDVETKCYSAQTVCHRPYTKMVSLPCVHVDVPSKRTT